MSIYLDRNSLDKQIGDKWEDYESNRIVPYSEKERRELSNLPANPPKMPGLALRNYNKQLDKVQGIKEKAKDKIISKAYLLYKRAYEGSLPVMVIGGSDLRGGERELEFLNFGTIAKETPRCSTRIIQTIREREKEAESKLSMTQYGAILCESSWDIIQNDAYVLGGIHARKTFYLYLNGPSNLSGVLWDQKAGRPRVVGREIIMLNAAGYHQVANVDQRKNYGATFVSLDPAVAQGFTVEKALDAVSKVTSEQTILKMCDYTPDDTRQRDTSAC